GGRRLGRAANHRITLGARARTRLVSLRCMAILPLGHTAPDRKAHGAVWIPRRNRYASRMAAPGVGRQGPWSCAYPAFMAYRRGVGDRLCATPRQLHRLRTAAMTTRSMGTSTTGLC